MCIRDSPNPDCLTKAKKKKALERCFEQPVPAEVYEALAAQLAEAAKAVSYTHLQCAVGKEGLPGAGRGCRHGSAVEADL